MARQQTSMDGFVTRRPNRRVGGVIGGEEPPKATDKEPARRVVGTPQPEAAKDKPQPASASRPGISRSEIDESLRGIDEGSGEPPRRKRKNPDQPPSNRRKWIKR